jgi:hypothetical protein
MITVQDKATEKRVLRAVRALLGKRKGVSVFYESGHWWCKVDSDEKTIIYDVIEADGTGSYDGIGLERA